MPITSIPTNDRRERFVASGGQTIFPFDFPVFSSADLTVFRLRAGAEAQLQIGSDYVLNGAGNQAGGNIVLAFGAVAGDVLTLTSNMPAARGAQFVNGGDLPATSLESEFNRQIILLQQIGDRQARSLRSAETDVPMLPLPIAARRANRLLVFDSAGNPIDAEVPGAGTSLTGNASLATARATGSSTSRMLAARFADEYNAKDHGIVGDYATDDAPAINALITLVSAAGGGTIYFPKGFYYVASTVVLKTRVFLRGAGPQVTTFIAANSTSHDVFRTDNYASLVGTNTIAAPNMFGLYDLSIDGNRYNRTGAGACLAIYGYGYDLINVQIYDSRGVGLYSEWSTFGGVPVTALGKDFPEAHIQRLITYRNAGDGIIMLGPHDTIMDDILSFVNGGVGCRLTQSAMATAGGTMLDNFHSYGNASWGLVVGTMIFGGLIESESNTAGGGIQTAGPGGKIVGGTLISWGNTGPGVELNIFGTHVNLIQAWQNTQDGVRFYSNDAIVGSINAYSNGQTGVVGAVGVTQIHIGTCRVVSNLGTGLSIAGNNWNVSNIYASANGNGGLLLTNGLSGMVITGQLIANTGTQVVFNTLGSGVMLTLNVFTGVGQTAYSGTAGNNFVRIAAAGQSTIPVNTVQV